MKSKSIPVNQDNPYVQMAVAAESKKRETANANAQKTPLELQLDKILYCDSWIRLSQRFKRITICLTLINNAINAKRFIVDEILDNDKIIKEIGAIPNSRSSYPAGVLKTYTNNIGPVLNKDVSNKYAEALNTKINEDKWIPDVVKEYIKTRKNEWINNKYYWTNSRTRRELDASDNKPVKPRKRRKYNKSNNNSKSGSNNNDSNNDNSTELTSIKEEPIDNNADACVQCATYEQLLKDIVGKCDNIPKNIVSRIKQVLPTFTIVAKIDLSNDKSDDDDMKEEMVNSN